MRKNIIIYGASRAGKTSLAYLINKTFNYSVFSIDDLVTAFGQTYPSLNINHKLRDGSSVKNISKFLWNYISTSSSSSKREKNINYVYEGSYFEVEALRDKQNTNKYIIIGLLTLYNSPKDYYNALCQFDTAFDWTYHLSKKELLDYSINLYNDNLRLKKLFDQYGIKYYDTSIKREETLEKIISYLKEIL